MQPNGHGRVQVWLGDDDCDLVTQTLAASEDNELGLRRAFERHRGTAGDLEGSCLFGTIAVDRGERDLDQRLAGDVRFGYRHDKDGGQDER